MLKQGRNFIYVNGTIKVLLNFLNCFDKYKITNVILFVSDNCSSRQERLMGFLSLKFLKFYNMYKKLSTSTQYGFLVCNIVTIMFVHVLPSRCKLLRYFKANIVNRTYIALTLRKVRAKQSFLM